MGAAPYPGSSPNPYPPPVEGQGKPLNTPPGAQYPPQQQQPLVAAGAQYPPQQQQPMVAAQGGAPYPPAAGYQGAQPQVQAAPGYPAAANAPPAGYPATQ